MHLKNFDVPGNLFLAISKESITNVLFINCSFFINLILHLKNLNQNLHYEL